MKTLDRDVMVVDPRVAEAQRRADMRGVHGKEAFERKITEHDQRRMESDKDVPLVEDMPLYPEEEAPDFRNLEMLLLRMILATERWKGSTHLTLSRLIIGVMTGTLDMPGADSLRVVLLENVHEGLAQAARRQGRPPRG